MSPWAKTSRALIVLLASVFCLAECSPEDWSLVVPAEWYMLPESAPTRPASDPETATKLGESLGEMLGIQGQAIARLSPIPTQPCPHASAQPDDWEPWHLGAVMTNFVITADGLLSPLLFQGTAALQTIWRPTPSAVNSNKTDSTITRVQSTARKRMSDPDLLIRSPHPMTEAQIASQLEPAIQGAMATGKIQNEDRLRANLVAAGVRFAALGARLDGIQIFGSHWSPQTFRLELPVLATGDISPVLSVGATVLFRFDWERSAPPSNTDAVVDTGSDDLTNLVQGLALDLEAGLGSSGAELAGYPLEVIRIGAGFAANATIGVAAVQAMAVGSFEFGRDATSRTVAVTNYKGTAPAVHDVAVIVDRARLARLPSANFAVTPNTAETAVVKLDHAKFQKGLHKAWAIGEFFAARATKQPHTRGWAISEFSTEYDLSITGDLGWVQAGGTSVVELTFSPPGAP